VPRSQVFEDKSPKFSDSPQMDLVNERKKLPSGSLADDTTAPYLLKDLHNIYG